MTQSSVRSFVELFTAHRPPPSFQHGIDVGEDIRRRRPDLGTIFDVGANVGQSAVEFSKVFPSAHIYSFEPFAQTFQLLTERVANLEKVTCVQKALGQKRGTVSVVLQGALTNSLVSSPDTPGSRGDPPAEFVEVETVETFCAQHGISHIDLLKIDTEGFDLDVLKGARALLCNQQVDYIQVEASMNASNPKHIPFADFVAYLSPLGYSLFGLYDQTPEWSGEARLRFANPVFVSKREVGALGKRPIKSAPGGLWFKQ